MADQDRIRELRNARGVAKRQLTLLEQFILGMTQETDFYVIEARFESLTRISGHFEAAQTELERLDPAEVAEPPGGELTEREAFENRFIQAKARLQRAIKESPDNSFNPPHNSTVVDGSSELPKMELPDFNGAYNEYVTFMEIFDTLVHNNNSKQLTNIRRLSILRNCCKGTALDLIGNLKLTNENYEVARTMLEERYNNPRRNFEECVAGMWEFEKATTAKGLRSLTDGIKSRLRSLERLGTKEQVVDGILIHMVMEKLDSTSRTKWEEQLANSKEISSWAVFEAFLEKRCTVWEAIVVNKSPMRPPTKPVNQVKKTYVVKSTASSCLLCDKNCKSLLECNDFKKMAPKKRFFKARELNLCYCCLKPAHEAPCEAPRCGHCGRLHNSLLHYGKYNNDNFKKGENKSQSNDGNKTSTGVSNSQSTSTIGK